MPLCKIVDECLTPVGTAFLISKLGVVATGAHVIQEALRVDPVAHRGVTIGEARRGHKTKAQLAVLHHRRIDEAVLQVNVWPLENIQIAWPTDVAFGFLKFQEFFPFPSLTLSPAAPRIGEAVLCVGWCDSKIPEGGIPLQEIKDGTFDWQGSFSHRFHVTEGKVRALFVERFARGYGEGPCFLTDSHLEHGQSGGPVFNSADNICGINLGSAAILTGQNSLASMIYPSLAVKITITRQLSQAFQLNIFQPLINLIKSGEISTDGSEELSRIHLDGDKFRIDQFFHEEDSEHTFRDLHGFQDSQLSIPFTKGDLSDID